MFDMFNLGNKYLSEGKTDMAMNIWRDCVAQDPLFGPAYINMFNVYNTSNNLPQAKECLEKFLNCPVTGRTIKMLPKVEEELTNITKKMNPQPQPAGK